MQKKHNILIFKDSGLYFGSLEKLLQLFAKQLTKNFNVFFAYAPQITEELKNNLEGSGVTLVPFSYKQRRTYEPYDYISMSPTLSEIIEMYHIECIYTDVFANYQYPMNSISAAMPFVLISPFGHYATNGNVQKVYVSGQSNVDRLVKKRVPHVEILYNPLEDFPEKVWSKKPVGDVVTFGRIGRGENSTFDPIAVKAFLKLEKEYGDRVRFIVVNPAPLWKTCAEDLGVVRMEYRENLSQEQVQGFYSEIDVFAHARKDGETVGMAIAEAMLAGNPILTHRSHFHNDHFNILDDRYAKWSDCDDVQTYYENMKYMVDHRDKIRDMGILARKRAYEIFVIDGQLPGIIKTFEHAITQCTYYTQSRYSGMMRLYAENIKKLPLYSAKIAYYFIKKFFKTI